MRVQVSDIYSERDRTAIRSFLNRWHNQQWGLQQSTEDQLKEQGPKIADLLLGTVPKELKEGLEEILVQPCS